VPKKTKGTVVKEGKDGDAKKSAAENDNKAEKPSAAAAAAEEEEDDCGSLLLTTTKKKRARRGKREKALPSGDDASSSSSLSPYSSSSSTTTESDDDEVDEDAPYSLAVVDDGFDAHTFTTGFASFDRDSVGQVLEAPEYVSDIFQRLFHAESKQQHLVPYMHKQRLTGKDTRSFAVGCMIAIHLEFDLLPETLYLATNILDRFLSKVLVEEVETPPQILAAASFLIASKYEDIYPPTSEQFVRFFHETFDIPDLLEMEWTIFSELCFSISGPTLYPFLARFLRIADATKRQEKTAHYYLESTLEKEEFISYRPSLLAAAAVLLATNHPKLLRRVDRRKRTNRAILKYAPFAVGELYSVAAHVAETVAAEAEADRATGSNKYYNRVRTKYKMDKYSRVARLAPPRADHILF